MGPRTAAEVSADRIGDASGIASGPRPYRVCASAFTLHAVTLPELSAAISRMSSSKAVGIDGVPLFAIKKCFSVIGPHILHLINSSIYWCTFPDAWKIARVTPVFKSGDRSDLNNFRPISILSVLSKIAEKVVCIQLTSYLSNNHILAPSQYAYRACHSTEDALLDAVEWLSRAVDQGHVATLTTIDLSKAFDSVDHSMLLRKLEWCGIASDWFASYLEGRSQHHFNSAALKLLVQTHVFPHILYCLSVWGGAADCHIKRVQKIINFAARLVTGIRRREHISPALEMLDWVSITDLVNRRDCRNVFRALHQSGSPPALRAMFVTRAEASQRRTRAVARGTAALHLPRVRLTATQLQRQFFCRAAATWNRLARSVNK